MHVRSAEPSDFDFELALNAEFEKLLSPLDRAGLLRLDSIAVAHRVAEQQGELAGFLLALGEGEDYASPNYRWFAARYARFLYVDRVVVAPRHRGRGVASALYGDLFALGARSGRQLVTCEYDREPLNEASARFHARLGFREIGTLAHASKVVSLQEARIALPSAGERA